MLPCSFLKHFRKLWFCVVCVCENLVPTWPQHVAQKRPRHFYGAAGRTVSVLFCPSTWHLYITVLWPSQWQTSVHPPTTPPPLHLHGYKSCRWPRLTITTLNHLCSICSLFRLSSILFLQQSSVTWSHLQSPVQTISPDLHVLIRFDPGGTHTVNFYLAQTANVSFNIRRC